MKGVKHLNVRPEKLGGNIGERLLDTGLDNNFLDMILKTTPKINKWVYIKLKNFCTASVNKMKRLHTRWDKVFANHVSDKVFISKTCKKLI